MFEIVLKFVTGLSPHSYDSRGVARTPSAYVPDLSWFAAIRPFEDCCQSDVFERPRCKRRVHFLYLPLCTPNAKKARRRSTKLRDSVRFFTSLTLSRSSGDSWNVVTRCKVSTNAAILWILLKPKQDLRRKKTRRRQWHTVHFRKKTR